MNSSPDLMAGGVVPIHVKGGPRWAADVHVLCLRSVRPFLRPLCRISRVSVRVRERSWVCVGDQKSVVTCYNEGMSEHPHACANAVP